MSLSTPLEYCENYATEGELLAAAYQLAGMGCTSVIWGCTSASFFRGMKFAQLQSQLLSESSGVPASNTAMAFLAALGVLRAVQVDILSPYAGEVTQTLVSFLSDAGISVRGIRNMRRGPRQHVFDIDCEAELAEFVASTPPSDHPILIPCTSISSLERVDIFERISGRPVITANQVTLWHALVLAGLSPNIADAGSLFRSCARTSDRSSV
ncbi:hypothetical protein [Mesorhizobium sp. M0239]|uniref:maleate cis-trans isomerase family protein n=1 Tax=Mesorhizobium sp. M0239 TaxID=2956924 RepID=UPI00333A0EC6